VLVRPRPRSAAGTRIDPFANLQRIGIGDETKPECRRCTEAGARCEYVGRVSFRLQGSQLLCEEDPEPLHVTQPVDTVRVDHAQPGSALSVAGGSRDDYPQPVSRLTSGGSASSDAPKRPLSTDTVGLLQYYRRHVSPWVSLPPNLHNSGHRQSADITPCFFLPPAGSLRQVPGIR
jgi:hypothetical protein